jgi:D-alanyl-D-alanine carboxypeptidase/D-alanyl-D-alanine-endopeptidase (penicillin-binding protein 4)
MKRLARLLCASTLSTVASLSLAAASAHAGLEADVNAVLADKLLAKAQASIDIVRLGPTASSAATLFQHHAEAPMVPASNLKVITTSAALERLGPDFKFRTLLVQHGPDLVLIGDGDPTLGDAEMLRKSNWDVDTVFRTWAAALAKRNIGPVRNVIVDDSVFDTEFLHPHWPVDQVQKRYVAEVAGLNLNANCVDFFIKPTVGGDLVRYTTDPITSYITVKNGCLTGEENAIWLSRTAGSNEIILRGQARAANDQPVSITVHDTPLFAGTVLAESLKAGGVRVDGQVIRDRSQRQAYAQSNNLGWTLLAVHETPLTTVISRANKDSMNLYAECVCKRLGFETRGAGTWANGTAAVAEFLKDIGVADSEYHLDDGCGLSKQNAISSNLMVKVLTHNWYGKNSKVFVNTLAVAGIDGTMEDRFRGTDLRGRVFAKSGFVNNVSTLSGYLHGKDDGWYAFSILLNEIPGGSNSSVKPLQEKIVRAIDNESRSGAEARVETR